MLLQWHGVVLLGLDLLRVAAAFCQVVDTEQAEESA